MLAKFHEIPSMGLQDIKETKRYGRTDGRTDAHTDARTDRQRENSIPPLKLCFGGGYNNVKLQVMDSFHEIHVHPVDHAEYKFIQIILLNVAPCG